MTLPEYNILTDMITTTLACYALIALWWLCNGRFLYADLVKKEINPMENKK